MISSISIECKNFLNGYIWPTDRALTDTTTQSGPGSDSDEVLLYAPQISRTGALALYTV